jgi:AraC-like DNA-binding protein
LVSVLELLPSKLILALKNADSFEKRCTMAEDYLLAQATAKTPDHYRLIVGDIVEGYRESGMHYNVSELAERYFLTSKTINRYFHRVIGTSPKDYFSILRARAALVCYADAEQAFDPTCFGYYDPSHFYREAARFTGFPLGSIGERFLLRPC